MKPLIGYMRVSKADGSQVFDLQRDALLSSGVPERNLYSDTASGKLDDRLGLDSCLKALRDGDTLVVWTLDRLGRNLRHLVNVVHDLTSRNIGFRVLTGQGASIDTTTPSGKLVFGIFESLAKSGIVGAWDARIIPAFSHDNPVQSSGLAGCKLELRPPNERCIFAAQTHVISCIAAHKAGSS